MKDMGGFEWGTEVSVVKIKRVAQGRHTGLLSGRSHLVDSMVPYDINTWHGGN